jgi:hypothetical protein
MKQTGLNSKIQAYTQDLVNLGPHNQKTIQDLHSMNQAYNLAAQAAAHGSQATKNFGPPTDRAGQAAKSAGDKVSFLAHNIDMLHSKTISVTTNFMTSGSNPYAGGISGRGAHGGVVTSQTIVPGFAGGGALPGFEPGVDSILAALSPGEGVLNPWAMRMIGGAPMLNWLNRTAEQGGAHRTGAVPGGGGVANLGGGGGAGHIHVYLDGKEIFASVKQQNSVYGTRNAGARTGLMIPGQKVGSGIS